MVTLQQILFGRRRDILGVKPCQGQCRRFFLLVLVLGFFFEDEEEDAREEDGRIPSALDPAPHLPGPPRFAIQPATYAHGSGRH